MDTNGILSIASLFEKEFSIDWLIDLSGLKPSQVLTAVNQCVKRGLLEEGAEACFRFQDGVERLRLYGSISAERREQLHREVVETIVKELPESPQRIRMLEKHLLHLPNDVERCGWLLQAGNACLVENDFKGALSCYRKVIDDLKSAKDEEANLRFLDAVNRYFSTPSAEVVGEWAVAVVREVVARMSKLGYRPLQAIYLLMLANSLQLRAEFKEADRVFDRGWKLAEKVEAYELFGMTFEMFRDQVDGFRIANYYNQGRFREAVQCYEATAKEVDDLSSGAMALYVSSIVGHAYAEIGQVNRGLGMLDAVRSHSTTTGNKHYLAIALVNIGYALNSIGRYREVLEFMKNVPDGFFDDVEAGLRYELVILEAFVRFMGGDTDAAMANVQRYLDEARNGIGYKRTNIYLMWMNIVMELSGSPRFKGLSLTDQIGPAINNRNLIVKGMGYFGKAILQAKDGDPPKRVLETLKTAVKHLDTSGHRLLMARTREFMVRMYLQMGDETTATREAKHVADVYKPYPDLSFPDDLAFLVKNYQSEENLLEEILKLGQEIVGIRDNRELVRYIILTVCRITGAERGAIFWRKKESGGGFSLRAAKNLTSQDIQLPEFEKSMAVVREVVAFGKGAVRKLKYSEARTGLRFVGERSCICVPMMVEKKIVGALYLDNRLLPASFRDNDLKTFAYFANLAAIAMDNALAYEEVRSLNVKLNEEKQYYEEEQLRSFDTASFIGESDAIKRVFDKALQVSDTDSTVLITGETGVGKELIAGIVRQNSKRRNRPFIQVNCSAFSENLIASELFGHEKGAFTGANERHLGRFELADKGTLFLDEIGDVPAGVQVRLLRILQNREFERVGGSRTLTSDFRLIAATNRRLQDLVKEGAFREDLFFRLNVFPIQVPPLRQRVSDIPLLVEHFVDKYVGETGKSRMAVRNSDMDILMRYDWPGNVRELKNIVERAVIMSSGPYLRIPESIGSSLAALPKKTGVTLAEAERNHILWALEKTAWKVSGKGGAAELLEINRSTLLSRMKKLGIEKKIQPASTG
ncbi:MAG: GAF domain-containing protein [Proteobacteria bacterium]|nr:GAF domain-containing protein [Pseudomonadota bacterium]